MKNKPELLVLESDFTISEAATLRDFLQTAIQNPDTLPLDLSRVQRFDTIGVQLLVSALKSTPEPVRLLADPAASPALARAREAMGLDLSSLINPTK